MTDKDKLLQGLIVIGLIHNSQTRKIWESHINSKDFIKTSQKGIEISSNSSENANLNEKILLDKNDPYE